MGIFSVVSNGLIGDCRGQFEELTMCQDQWNNLKVSFSYIITVEHDTWKWSPIIFRLGQLVPLENRWQDHCVAHEIFHHVKWQWRRHWFGKTEGQEQNCRPMDLESNLLFVNFNVVHFRDLIVFRIPVWLEDPFASEAISGLQIAFIHTGGPTKHTQENWDLGVNWVQGGSLTPHGQTPWHLRQNYQAVFFDWWVIPGNTAMMSMDAVSRVVVPLWFAGRETKVPVIIQTDGSQSCSWVFQFLFSDSQMHSAWRLWVGHVCSKHDKFIQIPWQAVVSSGQLLGGFWVLHLVRESCRSNPCSIEATQNSLHQFQVPVCWAWDPLSVLHWSKSCMEVRSPWATPTAHSSFWQKLKFRICWLCVDASRATKSDVFDSILAK